MEYSDYNNNGRSASTSGCNGMLYTIQRGDTLYKLSRRYNVSLSSLMNANPNVNVYNLQVGQQICMPGAMSSGNMGTGNMASGNANAQRPNRRPAVNNQYSGKNKNDNFAEYQCPECPACPEQRECPEQQPCPACPEQRECPEQQPCPACPPQRECPVQQPCPECPACPECEVCPEQQPCPECEVCPSCPEQQPCPACPEQQPCPECEACPSCPEQQPCPSCPEQQPCPECEKCPEQKPCPACKQKHTIVYVAPSYKKEEKKECKMEKAYKYVKPCKSEKSCEYEKPYKYEKSCMYEKKAPCDYDMESRWSKKMDYRMMYDKMDDDMDSRMYDGCSYGRMYKNYPQRRMMEKDESQCGCKMAKDYYGYNSCCKHGMMDESCFDRDYMDYTPKMYRGCFKKAKDCPCDRD